MFLLPNPLLRERRGVAADVIGDVHGCAGELKALLEALGWRRDEGGWTPPPGRVAAFVGDLINRGPGSLEVLALVSGLVESGHAVAALGNHDALLLRWLLHPEHGRAEVIRDTAEALVQADTRGEGPTLGEARRWLEASPLAARFVCGGEALVVVHAAWHPALEEAPRDVAALACLYGPTARLAGSPHRHRVEWRHALPAACPRIVHGHTAYDGPVSTMGPATCVDTACVFGGRLTALRWPEGEVVQVPARRAWSPYPNLPAAPPLRDPAILPPDQALSWPWNPAGPEERFGAP